MLGKLITVLSERKKNNEARENFGLSHRIFIHIISSYKDTVFYNWIHRHPRISILLIILLALIIISLFFIFIFTKVLTVIL